MQWACSQCSSLDTRASIDDMASLAETKLKDAEDKLRTSRKIMTECRKLEREFTSRVTNPDRMGKTGEPLCVLLPASGKMVPPPLHIHTHTTITHSISSQHYTHPSQSSSHQLIPLLQIIPKTKHAHAIKAIEEVATKNHERAASLTTLNKAIYFEISFSNALPPPLPPSHSCVFIFDLY